MRSRDTAACIFCGSSNVTKEHVFSRWTHKHMLPRTGKKAASFVGIEYEDRIESGEFRLSTEMRDWQIKCVCGGDSTTCNSGWMRRIEDKARLVLEPLILGSCTTLSEADQKLIATWAILKVMVAHHQIVHPARRKQMKSTQNPTKGWSVWIGNYNRGAWKGEWVSRPFSVLPNAVYALQTDSAARRSFQAPGLLALPLPDGERRWFRPARSAPAPASGGRGGCAGRWRRRRRWRSPRRSAGSRARPRPRAAARAG